MREDFLTNLDLYRLLLQRSAELHELADRAVSPSLAAGIRAAAEIERRLASAVFQSAFNGDDHAAS